MTRASLAKQSREVAAMFDGVARRYDLANDVLSLGQVRGWRKAAVRALVVRPGERVLDVAAGTGASSDPLVAAGADVVPCDFSLGMLAEGRRRRPGLTFVGADALRLPFADASFDAVSMSFGLRNVADTDATLAEALRVTRPAGRIVVCEFSHPTWQPFRTLYTEYLWRAVPMLARRVSSSPEAYGYLAESITDWPDQAGLAARLTAAGWAAVAWRNLSGGIVALHRGERPAGTPTPRPDEVGGRAQNVLH